LTHAGAAELKSFGVFLGGFASPPTFAQQRLLSQWDVLVVDPFQHGVSAALASCPPTSRRVLARVDMQGLTGLDESVESHEMIRDIDILLQTIHTHVRGSGAEGYSHYSGVLLAGFAGRFPPSVVNELVGYLRKFDLDVWLELGYPDYITENAAREIDAKLVQGVVYRNGTIRPDGDRQSYFQMTQMRAVMRAIAGQRALQQPALVVWETVDDAAALQYAVVTRTYNWSIYNCALSWIGHASALIDAEAAMAYTVPAKPLGALMWLKEEANMKAHDIWRANDEVSLLVSESDHKVSLLACAGSLTPVSRYAHCQSSTTRYTTAWSLSSQA
jgi:hypothetical protein